MNAVFSRKIILTVAVSIILMTVCCPPVYAAGFGGGNRGGNFGSVGFSSSSESTYLSYDALSELCIEVNYNLTQNVYASDGFPASGNYAANIVSREDGYYIGVKKNGSYSWFRNGSGGYYIAKYNTDSILSSIYSVVETIRVNLQNLYNQQATHFANIAKQLTNFQTLIDADISNLSAKLKTIVDQTTKINAQFRDFVSGHTVTDVITAIENIPASVYDDSKLLASLGRIESTLSNLSTADNTDILAALSRIETRLGDLNINLDFGDISADLSGVNTRLDSLIQNVMYISQTTLSDPDRLWNSSVVASGGWAWNEGTFSYTNTSETYTESTQLVVSFSNLSISNNCTVLTLPVSGAAYTGLEFQGDVTFVASGSPITIQLLNSLGNVISSTTVQTKNWSFDAGTSTASYTLPLTSSVAKVRLTFSSNVSTSLLSNFKVYGNARTGVGGSTGNLEFYVDGQHYTIGLPATAVNREYSSGAVVRSTVYYDSGSWYFRASATSKPVQLSEEITATMNGYLRSEAETVTWFSWFYDYTMNFQSWLGDKISGISVGSGGVTDLSEVTDRLDTIIDSIRSTPGDTECSHTYQQEATQEVTCALPGLMTYTCSKCGDSYSEIVAALGHDWQCIDHVEEVKDEETGEVIRSGYDIYTCSRCGDTYQDYSGTGAPEDYSDTSISKLVVRLFSRLGTFAGKLIAFIIGLFDKALSSVDRVITRFNELTDQITGFGGDYPTWLSGFWEVLPQELQLALTFAVVCMAIGVVGRKLVFS